MWSNWGDWKFECQAWSWTFLLAQFWSWILFSGMMSKKRWWAGRKKLKKCSLQNLLPPSSTHPLTAVPPCPEHLQRLGTWQTKAVALSLTLSPLPRTDYLATRYAGRSLPRDLFGTRTVTWIFLQGGWTKKISRVGKALKCTCRQMAKNWARNLAAVLPTSVTQEIGPKAPGARKFRKILTSSGGSFLYRQNSVVYKFFQ